MAIGSAAATVLDENRVSGRIPGASGFLQRRIDIPWGALARNEPSSIAKTADQTATGLVEEKACRNSGFSWFEDDEDVGEVLKIALAEEGYTVDFAATAAEAWRHLAVHRYALVLSDWRLPDGDGSVIADGGAELGAKTFIMSGFLPEMPAERREGHRCMMKPVRVRDLLQLIRDAIGAPTREA